MFIGLDLSLGSSGIVIIDNDYKIIYKDTLKVLQLGVERLYFLEAQLKKTLDNYPNLVVSCIESPAYRETGKIFELGEWAGIVKLELFKRSIPYIMAAPLALKKYVSGEGKSKGKETVLLDIFKNFNEEIRQDDQGDAYVLSRIAHDYHFKYIINEKIDIKKFQEEVLGVIWKTYGKYNINKLF
jgi:Holliday junction resolvasome RuvABC endonuclease subunit